MKKIKLLNPILLGTMLSSSLLGIVACNNKQPTTDEVVNQLVETTKEEFKNAAKNPRESKHLDKIQQYLTTWITNKGWTPHQDDGGNIYFDVPATSGKDNYPKTILQGHMDMVFTYDKSQTTEGGGTKEQPNPLTYEIEVVEDKVDGRPVFHTKDYFTSLGGDDTIGVAMIMALITNPNVAHGPLRVIFTSDEEIGLVGANKLDPSVLSDYQYLINLDGESKVNAEDMICTGCQGYCEYQYKMEFGPETATPNENSYKLEISGLKGGHCMDQEWIKYLGDGRANVGTNADKMALLIINELRSNYQVQFKSFTHYDKTTHKETSFKANQLPDNATVIFNTNCQDVTIIEDAIKDVINKDFQNKYPYENWSNVEIKVNTINSNEDHWILSAEDSGKLIDLFGRTIQSDILEWEGENDKDKVLKNYPLKTSNISTFKVEHDEENSKMVFTIGTRGCAGTNKILDDLKDNLDNKVRAVYPSIQIDKIKDYYPWDTTTYHKLNDFVESQFKSFGISPVCKKTRGGVEPAMFAAKKDGLEQVVLGPRIDDIHTPKETVYIDTIFNTMKAVVLTLQDINKLN